SKFAGVDIASFAQIDFSGFKEVVDALGGVEVDVPVDIIGDIMAEGPDIYAGNQVLNGEQALVFCRSRAFDIGDYQRQANQRTFLQALAKQVLASDPITIASTVTKATEMVTTNMDLNEIIAVASSMQGLKEKDIHTYSVPSVGGISPDDELWYELTIESEWQALIKAIDAGEYPEQDIGELIGEVPDSYKADSQKADDKLQGQPASNIKTAEFKLAVRNGYGEIEGAAGAVAGMLESAGYVIGEIGNTNAAVYTETLVIYAEDGDKAAAEDIKARIGYGRIIPSLERYSFEGNVLVIVGGDYQPL
ncbi:MAG: LCP family protein, partial [Coriobacteriaceae bacterium]|nr:LCP family protein [Coriobacteriaceae bacterium]